MLSMYPACFFLEDNTYSVIFPDLNYLATQGDTFEEAMEMAVDCLAGYLYSCQQDGEMLPPPSKMSDIDPISVSKELDLNGSECTSFVTMVTVDVAAYAKQNFERSIKKTLTIPAWLNKAALDQNINFSQVLQDALKAQLHIR